MSSINPLHLTEHQARQYLEHIRWPDGPVCPRCNKQEVTPVSGGRVGLYNCRRCRRQFTVTVGTIFEGSHIPLAKWVQAFHLLCASKKGMSALQLSRMLGITYKSAWHMAHRIRYAMQTPAKTPPLAGTVEVDETYVGGKNTGKGRSKARENKTAVVALVARTGSARAQSLKAVSGRTLGQAIKKHVRPGGTIMTDELPTYERVAGRYGRHVTVKHSSREYARGGAHTNTVESFFALLKRGIIGSFHHVSSKHLNRYCDEFAFRWSQHHVDDVTRTCLALEQTKGRRLSYQKLVGMN